MAEHWMLSDLTSPSEIARHYGVSHATVANWAARYDDFPVALVFIGGRPIYSWREIHRWHDSRDWQRPH